MGRISARGLLFGMIVAGILAACGVAPSFAAIIDACVSKKTGAVRIVASPADCHKSETLLSWNGSGAPGRQGPPGPPGPPGPTVLGGGSSGQGVLAGQENNMGPGNGFTSGPAGIVAVPMPPGSVGNLRVWLSVPPDPSGSYTFSVCTNPGFGGSCPMSCSIASGAQSCSDSSHTATLNGGDRLYVTASVSGTPPLSSAQWSVDFSPSGP
jgi:hypothetical protein